VDFLSKNSKKNMIELQTIFEIPNWIVQGLESREYVRIGGVIRDAKTKHIIAMLREIAPDISQASTLLTQAGSVASLLNLGVSILNLGVSVIGFALILKRLKGIEQRLEEDFNQIQENINHLHRKFDICVYANFRAALDLARDGTTMLQPENRRNAATKEKLVQFTQLFRKEVLATFDKVPIDSDLLKQVTLIVTNGVLEAEQNNELDEDIFERFLPPPDRNNKGEIIAMLPHTSAFTNMYARINRFVDDDMKIRIIHDEQARIGEILKVHEDTLRTNQLTNILQRLTWWDKNVNYKFTGKSSLE